MLEVEEVPAYNRARATSDWAKRALLSTTYLAVSLVVVAIMFGLFIWVSTIYARLTTQRKLSF